MIVAPRFEVERFTLPNGLRVVVSPDRSSPTAMVAVAYDVGFRSEPEGRTGFAHLFEHLMFEGSVNLPKGAFDKAIESNGGSVNGFTRNDQTVYVEIFPSNALEVVLFGEADRMHELALTEESLRNQVDVVKEEIRVNVHNRPYGGFPWLHLPAVMFETFPNAHDGYGSFEDLEAATLEDAADFFRRFYAPSNAVLTIAGDVDVDETEALVAKHFGPIPERPRPKRADFAEPIPSSQRRAAHVDPNAPRPALAVGYRVPDPIQAMREYMATVVLAAMLGSGEASRLHERLVKRDRSATHVEAYVGEFGDAFADRDPTMLQVTAYYLERKATAEILGALDEEVAAIANGAVEPDELERVTNAMTAELMWEVDQLMGRAVTLAAFELLRGRAELANDVPELLRAVTPDDVATAAGAWLDPDRRAVLEWVPGDG